MNSLRLGIYRKQSRNRKLQAYTAVNVISFWQLEDCKDSFTCIWASMNST